ncbi:hypothetical protein WKI71_03910 [Streptomyces sp. MS1.AVA.1]|uniref:Uncharacterized protein n=1 Tax=Streptomyces machairae TaxID=3134109 RepID=A0ABU8UGG6_9ACTN
MVLDGVRLAAAMTGAERGFVYLSDDRAEQAVRQALAESGPEVRIDVVRTQHTYVAGRRPRSYALSTAARPCPRRSLPARSRAVSAGRPRWSPTWRPWPASR